MSLLQNIPITEYMTFRRFNWNRKVKLRNSDSLYDCNKYDTHLEYLSPKVTWYLDMGLFETLEIILGEDLDIHFIPEDQYDI